MQRTQRISLVVVFLLAALVAFFALRTRQPPLLPADADHGRFVGAEPCMSCHGPQGSSPQSVNHPLGDDCMRCHGIAR